MNINKPQHLQHVDPIEKLDQLVEAGQPSNPSAKAAIDKSAEKLAFNMPNYGNGCIFKAKNRSGKTVWIHVLRRQGSATRTTNGARKVVGAVAKHEVGSGLKSKNPIELTERAKLKEVNLGNSKWEICEDI